MLIPRDDVLGGPFCPPPLVFSVTPIPLRAAGVKGHRGYNLNTWKILFLQSSVGRRMIKVDMKRCISKYKAHIDLGWTG